MSVTKLLSKLTSRVGGYSERSSPVLIGEEEIVSRLRGDVTGSQLRPYNLIEVLQVRHRLGISAVKKLTAERTIEGREELLYQPCSLRD